jgi:hypothetical protein
MLIGQTLYGRSIIAYSPWFSRNGNRGLFSAEVLLVDGGGGVQLSMESKNSEDVDSAAATVGTSAYIPSGVGTVLGTNLKELVRYKYTVNASGTSTAWVHFRVLPPAWLPN